MRVVVIAFGALALLLALAACNANGGTATVGKQGLTASGGATTSSTTRTANAVGGLIAAQFSVCAQQGQALATYLNTGLPTSNDPSYGDERQEALSLSGAQQALYIRQAADSYIERCDQQQQQTQTQDSEQAVAAAAAAKATAEEQSADPACQAVGGTVSVSTDGSTVSCGDISYVGTDGSTYDGADAPMNAATGQFAGPLDTDGIGATEQECTSGYYPELSTGAGYATAGSWNSAVQGCLTPS